MENKITIDQVRHIASLARLELANEEEKRIARQLASILEYVEKLNELDTSNVKPMHHAVERTNIFREDVLKQSLEREKVLANAPETDGVFFIVPRVL